eukprot:m.188559 g.188559  ORF g.188559 m.188559 type:complete len:194 (+) comp32348_c0_seq4:427-1008(+)
MQKKTSTTYLVVSALFFAASGFAQLNDPDPEIWVTLYIMGGVLVNILVWGVERKKLSVRNVKVPLQLFVAAMSVLCASICLKLWDKFPQPMMFTTEAIKPRLWEILEYEEGREIAGLLIMVLHDTNLMNGLSRDATQESKRSYTSFIVSLLAAVAVLSGIYLWVFYHEDLVRKQGVPHCEGLLSTSNTLNTEL